MSRNKAFEQSCWRFQQNNTFNIIMWDITLKIHTISGRFGTNITNGGQGLKCGTVPENPRHNIVTLLRGMLDNDRKRNIFLSSWSSWETNSHS